MKKNPYIVRNFERMPGHLTIKQIAALSGVSAGTVDRVLHNRGKVSPEALAAVQSVLESQSYKYNLHTSAVAFKKTRKSFKIVVAIPTSEKGEYWDLVRMGVEKAFLEYGDISIKSKFVFFDQFNSLSCRDAFHSVASMDFSGAILGTTFVEETRELCSVLEARGIPYIFIDGKVPETRPIASYEADQAACGRLLARLMDGLTPSGLKLALLLPHRVGSRLSNNSAIRMAAFKAFFEEDGRRRDVVESYFSAESSAESRADIRAFLTANPDIGGVAVVISAGYLISDALSGGKGNLVIGGFDVTEGNARCLREGTLDFLINQHPGRQGFYAVESMLHFLLYGAPDKSLREYLPIDIVFRESLPYWHDEI